MTGKRMLHKNICTSEKLSSVSYEAESLYYRIIVNADDEGRFFANPHTIKDMCLPLRDTDTKRIRNAVDELSKSGLIHIYVVHGVDYLEVDRFLDFQILRSDVKKRIDFPIRNESVTNTERIRAVEVKDKDKEEDKDKVEIVWSFDDLWFLYPKQMGKTKAKDLFDLSVHCDQDYIDIKKALNNYKDYCKTIDHKFVKNGSTWFSEWRDWVDWKLQGVSAIDLYPKYKPTDDGEESTPMSEETKNLLKNFKMKGMN
jgi:hypothetical protein